jgi:UDP-N-acetylglucosamine 2-epimerase
MGIAHKPLSSYFSRNDIARAEKNSMTWMKDWSNKIICSRGLKDTFMHDGLSIYWLMDNCLFYPSIYFDSFRDVLNNLQYIDGIITRENPDKIIFMDDGKISSKIINLLGSGLEPVENKTFRKLFALKQTANEMAVKWFLDFRFHSRKLLWKALKVLHRQAQATGKKKIVFISVPGWKFLSEAGMKEDPYIYPLLAEFKKSDKYEIKTVGIPVGRLIGLDYIRKKIKDSSYRILESYHNKISGSRTWLHTKRLQDIWKDLKETEDMKNSMMYKGISIFSLLEPQLSCYFSARLKDHIRDYEMVRSMIEEEKPDIVVYPGETSEFGRTLFHLCRKNNIPCIGIQHGVLGNRLRLTLTKQEASGTTPDYCPIPTVTAVYGDEYKRILIREGHYPRSSIEVTGSQRFDEIIKKQAMFKKQGIYRKFGIKKQKIVLLVTSPVPENEIMTRAVFNTMKKFPDIQLIVKLHPLEADKLYRNLLKETGSNAIITTETDIYELLNACEIMITHLSTVGLEAMILDKPVITINISGKPDPVDYARKKAALGVYREQDLVLAIENLLKNRGMLKELKKNRDKYVYETTYKKDGKATERVAELIERLI